MEGGTGIAEIGGNTGFRVQHFLQDRDADVLTSMRLHHARRQIGNAGKVHADLRFLFVLFYRRAFPISLALHAATVLQHAAGPRACRSIRAMRYGAKGNTGSALSANTDKTRYAQMIAYRIMS